MRTVAAFFLCLFPLITCALDARVVIVNHYPATLTGIVNINAFVLPDIPANFSLAYGDTIASRVLEQGKQAYVSIRKDDTNHSVYFGVESKNNKLIIHGYISKNIAFSWKESTVTLCTPEEYKKNGSC